MFNSFKTVVLLGLLTGFLLLIGKHFGGNAGMVIALIFSLGMNFFSWWYSDKIVLSMYGAREVGEDVGNPRIQEIQTMLASLARRGGIPVPKLYIVDDPSPNAFATGRDPNHAAVAVTTGIMDLMTTEELSGVLGHELTHVINRDTLISTVAASLAGAVTMLANMAQWAALFGGREREEREGGGWGDILMVILAPVAGMLVQMAISRSREFAADAGGARLCGNPLFLARALAKLERGVDAVPMNANPATSHMFILEPFHAGGLMSLFSTHPPTEERIRRLEMMAGSSSPQRRHAF
ncbi:MAG: zinc metalloprotease HtpX [Nitrospirae bacterium]|jgi:heat shock protein HtpX|uniref:Protease HtpX homolog n=1 Tax=Leptospirillum ferrodiazotrophum TaxID=412449 RepID=C6HZ71_9BACT|nr:MAG: peptidase M48, Ste24p [Leptospirillum ferrodiazotrophum]MCL5953245.1 zinc metalloprotease HtpX [Nitrospirota bacterium]